MHLNANNKLRAIFLSLIFLLGLSSCTLVEDPDDQLKEENNYYESKEVSDILSSTCATSGCHDVSLPINGFSTQTQPEIMLGALSRPLNGASNYGGDDVIPFNHKKSLLYQFITGNIANDLSYDHSILSQDNITTIKNWIDNGAQNHKGEIPFTIPKSYRVYVCNQNSEYISVIDGTDKVVSHLTDLYNPLTEFDTPYWVAEFGNYYYVTLSSAGEFVKINKSDNSVVSVISGLGDPGIILINKDGTNAYISRAPTTESLYKSIYLVNLTTMTLQKEINLPVNGLPHGMALDYTRNYLYIADAVNNVVNIINTYTNQVIDLRFDLINDIFPLFLDTSLDGNYVYITAYNTSQLLVANANSRIVVSKIDLLPNPTGVIVSSTGQKIYVASSGGDAVEVITKSGNYWNKTNTIIHPTMSIPYGIDISSDDNYLYVTNQNIDGDFTPAYQVKEEGYVSTVTIINTLSETVEKAIEVEEAAAGIVVEQL